MVGETVTTRSEAAKVPQDWCDEHQHVFLIACDYVLVFLLFYYLFLLVPVIFP